TPGSTGSRDAAGGCVRRGRGTCPRAESPGRTGERNAPSDLEPQRPKGGGGRRSRKLRCSIPCARALPLPSAHEGIRVAYLRAYGSPSGFAAATKDDCILRNSRGVQPHRRDTKPRGASPEIGPQPGKGPWTALTI